MQWSFAPTSRLALLTRRPDASLKLSSYVRTPACADKGDVDRPGGQFALADTATDLDRWMPAFLLYDTGMAQPNRAAIRADEVCNEIAEIDPA
jgi:hypothetical protein